MGKFINQYRKTKAWSKDKLVEAAKWGKKHPKTVGAAAVVAASFLHNYNLDKQREADADLWNQMQNDHWGVYQRSRGKWYPPDPHA